jgi:hypothetical protein
MRATREAVILQALIYVDAVVGKSMKRPASKIHFKITGILGINTLFLAMFGLLGSVSAQDAEHRVYRTSFESMDEFSGFYILPKNQYGTASYELSTQQVHSGRYAHKGYIYGSNYIHNHRAYPTIQLQKLPGGGFRTPCVIEFWVWLDVALKPGEWFSFATFTPDPSDKWSRVVTLNIGAEGWPHLMHVPAQNHSEWIYQNKTIQYPMKEWVKFRVYLDFSAEHGCAKAWMNGQLVSEAKVEGGHGMLEQAHFGLYAHPSVSKGEVYNDDLVIFEGTGNPVE